MYFQNYHCFVAASNFYLNLLNWFNIQINIIYFSFKDNLIQFQSTSIKDFTFCSYQKSIIRTTKNLQSMSECVWQLIKCSFKYTIHKFQYFHNLMPVYDGILSYSQSVMKIYLKIRLMFITCRETLSVSCLLQPCLNHWSYLIRNSISSKMELQWVPN